MNSISFPSFVRSKITWTIDNFSPELLKNPNFYSFESTEFSIKLSSYDTVKTNTKWKLSIYKTKSSLSIYIKKVNCTDYYAFKNFENLSVGFEVGLLDNSGGIINKSKGNFPNLWYSEKLGRLINYKELMAKQWKLLNGKKLSIVVRLDLTESSKVKKQDTVMSSQYEKLFNNVKFSDFILVTSEGDEIPVHKNIMSIRSPVFETMMETKMLESKQGRATISDIEGKALMEFIRFIYCGRVENIHDFATELMHAASKYDLPDLKPLCVASLTEKLSTENVIETMMLANLHEEKGLKLFCIDFVKWHYEELKTLEGWKLVPQSLYKDIVDALLPTSNESIIIIASKIVISAGAQLNATVNAGS